MQDRLEFAVANLEVQQVEPGRMDFDQNIVLPQRRLRHVAQAKDALLLVSIEDEGFHDGLFSDLSPSPGRAGEALPPAARGTGAAGGRQMVRPFHQRGAVH